MESAGKSALRYSNSRRWPGFLQSLVECYRSPLLSIVSKKLVSLSFILFLHGELRIN